MGSGASREDVIDSKWWEAKAQKILVTTTDISKVEVICSLVPFEDEKIAIGLLKARPDLDTLFVLYCKYQDPYKEERTEPRNLTVDFKAKELWRVIRMPLGYSEFLWDWNWQPPLSGTPSEIANEFRSAISCAIFRVPFFDFVKYALGYDNALFVKSFICAVCDVRDSLQRTIQSSPNIKDIYVKVEKILQSRHPELTHWIVASSLSYTPYPLHDALALIIDPVKTLFVIRNMDSLLKQLPVFDRRFKHVNQKYNWVEWSSDLDFWDCTYQALWTERPAIPSISPHLLSEDRDEKLSFIESLQSITEEKGSGAASKALLFLKRLRGWRRRTQEDSRLHNTSKA